MGVYINKAELLKELSVIQDRPVRSAIQIIKVLPAIDLVRCGECKYQYMCGHQINRHGLTLKLTCCEYGERRADEHNIQGA